MTANVDAMNARITIDGLHWIERWRIGNGRTGSFVVPFATTRPVNIVTHGEKTFSYGQYGIHLAQQDVLTFLGDERQCIRAKFMDCRTASPTFRTSQDLSFTPSSSRTLIIPPGIAHTFEGLESVTTLNTYTLLLPPIHNLMQPHVGWTPENDIINLPLDTDPTRLEGVTPMSEPAAHKVYYQLAALQASTLSGGDVAHAETRTFTLATGEAVTLLLQSQTPVESSAATFPISQINGVRFDRHGAVHTGEDSRIIPLAGPSPFYIVDHGPQPYDFDSFGVHLGQEDHLTFMGSPHQTITLKLVDMRQGSDTLHLEEWHSFPCSAEMELVIPCGVAHALFGMGNVFTLNRPVLYLDAAGHYEPGKDVIDWPLTDTGYPTLEVNQHSASLDYLEALVQMQQRAMSAAPEVETPKAVLITDPATGEQVKVILTRADPARSDAAS